jgi:Cu+-exporting ATPase
MGKTCIFLERYLTENRLYLQVIHKLHTETKHLITFRKMKKLLYIIMAFVFVSCQSGTKNKAEEKQGIETSQVVESTVHIGGMHCDMCVASIEKGINEIEGIQSVAVSLGDSTAVVSYDATKVDKAKIEKAIQARGYTIKTGM